jgi:hypothetical protein
MALHDLHSLLLIFTIAASAPFLCAWVPLIRLPFGGRGNRPGSPCEAAALVSVQRPRCDYPTRHTRRCASRTIKNQVIEGR